jgi:hypothetical protein
MDAAFLATAALLGDLSEEFQERTDGRWLSGDDFDDSGTGGSALPNWD